MHVLSVIHGTDARAELFEPAIAEAGHALDEWSFGWSSPPPRPLDAYDAVLVFGGAMHADQDEHHPWLREETMWLQQLLGRHTPVLGSLPPLFEALQWHHYTYGLPAGAVELARSPACTQAFRLGDACWGVQFHPEVTAAQLESWIVDASDPPPNPGGLRAETPRKIDDWNELGRTLCTAFLDAAERVPVRA